MTMCCCANGSTIGGHYRLIVVWKWGASYGKGLHKWLTVHDEKVVHPNIFPMVQVIVDLAL